MFFNVFFGNIRTALYIILAKLDFKHFTPF